MAVGLNAIIVANVHMVFAAAAGRRWLLPVTVIGVSAVHSFRFMPQ
jgi:predicted acyltransferase